MFVYEYNAFIAQFVFAGNSNKWYMGFDKHCQLYIQDMVYSVLVHGKSYVAVNKYGASYKGYISDKRSIFHLPRRG